MHSQFANRFYGSAEWQQCRTAYKKARSGLCERCLANGLIEPGVEVHHKIRLTPQNIKDPSITLNWDNLELLCEQCHAEEHERNRPTKTRRRYTVDVYGRVDVR